MFIKGGVNMEGSRAQSFVINNERLRKIQQGKAPDSVNDKVKIDYFGHSAIRITSLQGISVLIDPWRNDEAWGWWFPETFPEVEVDLALSTHAHFDHDALHLPQARMTMERMIGVYELGDVKITGLADKHLSESLGKTRWTDIQKDIGEDFSPPNNHLHMDNVIYVIETGGVCIVHWGDNRAIPDSYVDTYLKDKAIDVLFLPVDESGHILTYEQADYLMERYQPGVTIPIHYLMHGVNTVLSTLQPCDEWLARHEEKEVISSFQLELDSKTFQHEGKKVAKFLEATRA